MTSISAGFRACRDEHLHKICQFRCAPVLAIARTRPRLAGLGLLTPAYTAHACGIWHVLFMHMCSRSRQADLGLTRTMASIGVTGTNLGEGSAELQI